MTTIHPSDHPHGVRLLTLDRPPANAINGELLGDLAGALDGAREDDGVRAVVLTGAGRFFSGGLDLRGGIDFQAAAGGADPFSALRAAMLKLLGFPKPTVAMIGGHAIAGGLIIALACDFRFARAPAHPEPLAAGGGASESKELRIGLNEVAIGASFPRAAFEIVRLRLSHEQANEVLLGAALYPVSKAARLGVAEALPADGFEAAVMERAARLGAYPREAYAHTKLALVGEAVARIEAETAEEAASGVAVWMTAESVAARAAQARKLGGGG